MIISYLISSFFATNVCASLTANGERFRTSIYTDYNGEDYVTNNHYFGNNGFGEVSFKSQQNFKAYFGEDNAPLNVRNNNKENLYIQPKDTNNKMYISETTAKDKTTAKDVKYNSIPTTNNNINNIRNRSNNVSDSDIFKRDFYSNIAVNSKFISVNRIFNKKYSFAGEYNYVDGELAHFKCENYQLTKTKLIHYDRSFSKIVDSNGEGEHVEAYIRLQASNNPIKILCLTKIINDTEYITFTTIVYLIHQKKEHNPPNFIVNGLTLPIIHQHTSSIKLLDYYESEYFSSVNEDLEISLSKSDEFKTGTCNFNLLVHPKKELKDVTYNNDTISFKARTFILICELKNAQNKSYYLKLNSITEQYNHLPFLNGNNNKTSEFENFINTDPCVYGLYWSNVLAKFNKHKNHPYVRYQYEKDREYIKIVCISKHIVKVHYNKTEVSINKLKKSLIEQNNISYFTYEYKVILMENFNKSSITFHNIGQYTVELIKTELKPNLEKMMISGENNIVEATETKSNPHVLLQAFDDITNESDNTESPEDVSFLRTAPDNVNTTGSEKSNIVEIITITVSSLLIMIIIVLGIIGAVQVLRSKKNQREPKTVIYNNAQSEHVYETIDYDTIHVGRDIKLRPPYPLPLETMEENQPVYDSPYDFRIF